VPDSNNKEVIHSSYDSRKLQLQEMSDDIEGIVKRDQLLSGTTYTLDKYGNYIFSGQVHKNDIYKLSVQLEQEALTGDCWLRILNTTKDIKDYIQFILAAYDKEVFVVIFLDRYSKLIEVKKIFFGTENRVSIKYKTIIKNAINLDASSLIFAHNHPLGNCRPSQADKEITKELSLLLATIDVYLQDHLIVADSKVYSFKESGLL